MKLTIIFNLVMSDVYWPNSDVFLNKEWTNNLWSQVKPLQDTPLERHQKLQFQLPNH